jgi:hypothetical protein
LIGLIGLIGVWRTSATRGKSRRRHSRCVAKRFKPTEYVAQRNKSGYTYVCASL